MYSIYADGACVYDSRYTGEELQIIDPTLALENASAGSLSFTLPPTHPLYGAIERLITTLSVYKDGGSNPIWEGRALSEEADFWNNRKITCEGALAYLNDTTVPLHDYNNYTISQYFGELLANHNSHVPENRRFTLGVVTVTEENPDNNTHRYTNYESTLTLINDVVERNGGVLRVRIQNGIRYLDYLKDYPNTSSQVIRFGTNLLDFTRTWDLSEFATVLVPFGRSLDDDERSESTPEEVTEYLTVAEVNDGSVYVCSEDAVNTYGWIEKTVRWDDISTPETLLSKAQAYLSKMQFDHLSLELNAVDLHLMDISVDSIDFLDNVRVISEPHGLDREFPVTKLDIKLMEPDQTTFTLGDEEVKSLSARSTQVNEEVLKRVGVTVGTNSILDDAKRQATVLINAATTGYITLHQSDSGMELLITDDPDYTQATKVWRWNQNGLGYSNTGYSGEYGLAMTIDGSIVADRITTGTLEVGDNITIQTPARTGDGYKMFYLSANGLQLRDSRIIVEGTDAIDPAVVIVDPNALDADYDLGAIPFAIGPNDNYSINSYTDILTLSTEDMWLWVNHEGLHIGNSVFVNGNFEVRDTTGQHTQGFMGRAHGNDGTRTTDGVALSYATDPEDLESTDNYVIVTDSGTRMQAGGHSVYVGANGGFYDNDEIATIGDLSEFVTASVVSQMIQDALNPNQS